MKTIGKIKRKRAFWQIDDVAFWRINEDFIGEKIELEFFEIDFFTFFKLSGGGLKLGDPEEIGGKMLDFAGAVVFGELLLVVVEASCKATFGVFVHFVGANLEFDDFFVWRDDGGVE